MKGLKGFLLAGALPLIAFARMSSEAESAASMISVQGHSLDWGGIQIGMSRSEVEKVLKKPLRLKGDRESSQGTFSARAKHKQHELALRFGGKEADSKLWSARVFLDVSCEISNFKNLKEVVQRRADLKLLNDERCVATFQLKMPESLAFEHLSQRVVLKNDGIWMGYASAPVN